MLFLAIPTIAQSILNSIAVNAVTKIISSND